MPDPPPATHPDPDEARDIPDEKMIFRSTEPSSPKQQSKSLQLKATKARIKLRKSTPASSLKGIGRKRFVPSPQPEDKQLRKKLSFECDASPNTGSPKCKASIFPESISHGDEESSRSSGELLPREIVNEGPTDVEKKADSDYSPEPAAGRQGTGEVEGLIEEVMEDTPLAGQMELEDPSMRQTALELVEVNLPEMVATTNLLSESALSTFHSGTSRDIRAVELPMQPKKSPFLQLVSLDVAEELDCLVAQPLLAGNDTTKPLPANDQPLQLPWKGDRIEPGHTLNNGPSYEDFPPLERGRTRRIRESFEKGSKQPDTSTKSRTARDTPAPLTVSTTPSNDLAYSKDKGVRTNDVDMPLADTSGSTLARGGGGQDHPGASHHVIAAKGSSVAEDTLKNGDRFACPLMRVAWVFVAPGKWQWLLGSSCVGDSLPRILSGPSS